MNLIRTSSSAADDSVVKPPWSRSVFLSKDCLSMILPLLLTKSAKLNLLSLLLGQVLKLILVYLLLRSLCWPTYSTHNYSIDLVMLLLRSWGLSIQYNMHHFIFMSLLKHEDIIEPSFLPDSVIAKVFCGRLLSYIMLNNTQKISLKK